MTISFLFSLVSSFMLNCYQTRGIVVDTAPNNGIIVETNGNVWGAYASGVKRGDIVKVVFHNHCTNDTIFDDMILQVEKIEQ